MPKIGKDVKMRKGDSDCAAHANAANPRIAAALSAAHSLFLFDANVPMRVPFVIASSRNVISKCLFSLTILPIIVEAATLSTTFSDNEPAKNREIAAVDIAIGLCRTPHGWRSLLCGACPP